jgi:hypothetical protein
MSFSIPFACPSSKMRKSELVPPKRKYRGPKALASGIMKLECKIFYKYEKELRKV